MWKLWGAVAVAVSLTSVTPRAQQVKSYDDLLDSYVRGGLVYYRALKAERSKLDSYVNQLGNANVDGMPRDEQIAFWLNAYNALVLKTVVDHYPIAGHSAAYPQKSIRQIPGAFDKTTHHVGGKTMTLDQIEQTILPSFKDPRVYFALGRGAEGGGRLRSEMFTATKLAAQLEEVEKECASRHQCVQFDRDANKVTASPIFSWREKEFVDGFADKASSQFSNRSPIERAVLGFVGPSLLTTEKEALDANTFQVAFGQFDWRLNDLTGRGGR